jgi:hypothetical protein
VSDSWSDQITDFFDGSPSKEDAARFNEWIKADPRNVLRFIREAVIHSQLHDLINGEEAIRREAEERTSLTMGDAMILPAVTIEPEAENEEVTLPPPPIPVIPQEKPVRFSQRRWFADALRLSDRPRGEKPVQFFQRRWFWAASIVLPLLIGFGIYRFAERPRHFATLVSSVDAQWEGPYGELQPGQKLPNEQVFLQAGVANIKFETGATIVVEAPARFQIDGANAVKLALGQVAAKVPTNAHGFAVETDSTRVVDLGTEFGVAVTADGSDDIQVFKGTVRAEPRSAGAAAPLTLTQGQAAVSTGYEIKIDPAGAQPQRFVRQLGGEPSQIDLVDLISGGDGTTHRNGIAIDYARHAAGKFDPVGVLTGDYQYHRVSNTVVVDGCFIPDGTKGPVEVNSIGQTHVFPPTSNQVYDQIWTGGHIPGLQTYSAISTVLGGIDYAQADHSILFMSSNGGVTIDMAAIHRLHPGYVFKRLQCVVGNSFSSAENQGSIATADVCVLAGDKVLFEERKFTNIEGPFPVDVPLDPADRFLTFVVTDGGDGIGGDGILWADPKLIGEGR